jgi:hypothetical protein
MAIIWPVALRDPLDLSVRLPASKSATKLLNLLLIKDSDTGNLHEKYTKILENRKFLQI